MSRKVRIVEADTFTFPKYPGVTVMTYRKSDGNVSFTIRGENADDCAQVEAMMLDAIGAAGFGIRSRIESIIEEQSK